MSKFEKLTKTALQVSQQVGQKIGQQIGQNVQQFIRLVNTRKPKIIHPPFQLRVVFYGMSIAFFALALTYIAMRFFFWRCVSALAIAGIAPTNPVYEFIYEQQRFMLAIFIIVGFLSLVFAVIIGWILSHRVAGPLHRLRQHFLAMAAGRAPQQIKFRENDYFQELAEAYNLELKAREQVRRPGSEPNRQEQDTGSQNSQPPQAA